MDNQSKLKNSKEIIAFLSDKFPHCFSIKGIIRPLKIGIFQDLIKRIQKDTDLSKTQLRAALRLYTSSWRYLYSVKMGINRIDLDGNICEKLEKKHIEYASRQIEHSKNRIKNHQGKKRQVASFDINKALNDKNLLNNHLQSKLSSNNVQHSLTSIDHNHNTVSSKNVSYQLPLKIIDKSTLQPGKSIKIRIANCTFYATILEMQEDNIRVLLDSGIAVLIRLENFQC